MSSKLAEDVHALIGQSANDFDYSSCDPDNQTHLTIASMLRDNDRYHIATISVFLCGIGSFLTFMVIASAPDYIEIVYPSYPDLMYLLVSIYNTANMIGLIIMLSPLGTYISIAVRLQYGYILTALFSFFIPTIPYIFDSEQFQVTMFILINGVISGLSSALLCTSLFSFAAMLPPTYLITAVGGQSFAGILSAIIRIIYKASFNTNIEGTKQSGIGCFAIAGCLQLLAAITFTFAIKSDFVQQFLFQYWAIRHSKYLDKGNSNNNKSDDSDFKPPIINNYNYDYSHLHADFVNPGTSTITTATTTTTTTTNPTGSSVASTDGVNDDLESVVEMSIKTAITAMTVVTVDEENENNAKNNNRNPTTNEAIEKHLAKTKTFGGFNSFNKDSADYICVIKKIYKCLLSIFIGYGGTYLVFPSMLVGLDLNNQYLMRTKWNGVILYLIWSIFGWIGIYIAKKVYLWTTYDNLCILQCIWMFIMYVLFIAANEEWITSDIYTYMIVLVTPLIFGFLSARSFAELPSRVSIFETEIAQAITQLTLLSGILIGGWIAYSMNELFIVL